MSQLGISMCGTKHSHSAGILMCVLKDDRVNFKGVYEPRYGSLESSYLAR